MTAESAIATSTHWPPSQALLFRHVIPHSTPPFTRILP